MATNTSSLKDATIIFGGAVLSGFSDGESIRISRREANGSLTVGADGEGCMNFHNDNSVEITINLLETALSNSIISAISNVQKLASGGGVPFVYSNGATLCEVAQAYVQNPGDLAQGKEHLQKTIVLIGIADVFIDGSGV